MRKLGGKLKSESIKSLKAKDASQPRETFYAPFEASFLSFSLRFSATNTLKGCDFPPIFLSIAKCCSISCSVCVYISIGSADFFVSSFIGERVESIEGRQTKNWKADCCVIFSGKSPNRTAWSNEKGLKRWRKSIASVVEAMKNGLRSVPIVQAGVREWYENFNTWGKASGKLFQERARRKEEKSFSCMVDNSKSFTIWVRIHVHHLTAELK